LLIEAHQEGTLEKITNIFNVQENIPNFKGDMIRNPFNNQSYSKKFLPKKSLTTTTKIPIGIFPPIKISIEIFFFKFFLSKNSIFFLQKTLTFRHK